MKCRLTLLILLFIPFRALALDYSDLSLLFTDAPFVPSEAAGISLLKTLGAVEGNPDGTFAPSRTLNRAEFLKIALLSAPNIRVSSSDSAHCFPDVLSGDWFSKYVCLAKKRGIVSGYPNGEFKPANTVNYAEALKMLGELYSYTAYAPDNAPWYEMYAQAAVNHKTNLPINIAYDANINRGQMARLAAAYRAEHEGELDAYRLAEKKQYKASSSSLVSSRISSSPSSSSVSTSESSSSIESSSSSSSQQSVTLLKPVEESRLLQVGRLTAPIAHVTFTPREGDAALRNITVILDREVKLIKALVLLTEDGQVLGEIPLDSSDTEKVRWKKSFTDDVFFLHRGEEQKLFVAVHTKALDYGAIGGKLIKVKKISTTFQNVSDGFSYELIGDAQVYPTHMTTMGSIRSIENAGEETGTLREVPRQKIASFHFSATTTGSTQIYIGSLRLTLNASDNTVVSNISIQKNGSIAEQECSREDSTTVNCLSIPSDIGHIDEGLTLDIYADVTLKNNAQSGTLRVSLESPGTLGSDGSVHWNDGSVHYTWVQLPFPLAEGTSWTVEQN